MKNFANANLSQLQVSLKFELKVPQLEYTRFMVQEASNYNQSTQ
ncbi:hypothetical protein [Halobacillus sp. BBL2006]|nr:hypothetical protein [Halobacillus sp. BBL2006]